VNVQLALPPAVTVRLALALLRSAEPFVQLTPDSTNELGTISVTPKVPAVTVNGPAVPVALTVVPLVVIVNTAGGPPMSLVMNVKLPIPPREIFVTVMVPMAWSVKVQLPLVPAVAATVPPQLLPTMLKEGSGLASVMV
jgi:hypothetical protein